MTHQIHHQGQLSQLFDELGIEHEFGTIFPLVPDSTADSTSQTHEKEPGIAEG